MKLIVGLGNVGAKYEKTRHNAGFRAVRAFHTLHAAEFGGWTKKFNAEISEGRIGDEKVALLLPLTYMNLSGDAVGVAAGFWHVEAKDIIVVYDELDVPLGNIRIRATGSAGGHNGIKSIIERLGTPDVPRIRIGIGTERAKLMPSEDFVLGKFMPEEEEVLGGVLEKTVQALDEALRAGLDSAANKFGK
jgi:PTH1 family peptidyl-tRNA hydrolase